MIDFPLLQLVRGYPISLQTFFGKNVKIKSIINSYSGKTFIFIKVSKI